MCSIVNSVGSESERETCREIATTAPKNPTIESMNSTTAMPIVENEVSDRNERFVFISDDN